MGAAVLDVTVEQVRHRVQQERQQRAIGFGQSSARSRARSAAAVGAERVPGDRLQQERVSQPAPRDAGPGAIQDWRERRGRRVGVVLGEPQHRGGDTHLPAVAVMFTEADERFLCTLRLAEANQGVHEHCPHPRHKLVRCGQVPGQLLGGSESG